MRWVLIGAGLVLVYALMRQKQEEERVDALSASLTSRALGPSAGGVNLAEDLGIRIPGVNAPRQPAKAVAEDIRAQVTKVLRIPGVGSAVTF